jgi:predicted  nucleic acid-binding Zn-ribbon protein
MYNRRGVTGMSSLQNTIMKIKNLEAEKKSLLSEIDELNKMADAKASDLEAEVASLREEAKTLKTLIGQG